MYVCMYVCMYMYVFVCLCVCVCVCVCVCNRYIYTNMRTRGCAVKEDMEFDANAHAGGGREAGASEWMSERKDAGQWEGLDLEDVGERQREASEVLVYEALRY